MRDVGEQAQGHPDHAGDREQGAGDDPAVQRGDRHGDVVAQRLDRGDPRGPDRRQQGGEHGDDHAHGVRRDHRPRLEDQRLTRDVEAEVGEQRSDRRWRAGRRGPARGWRRARRARTPRRSTELVTCFFDAPIARSRASSRLRWATRMEKVLTIRKAPTTSEMPAKISRNVVRNEIASTSWLADSSAALSPVTASSPSGSCPATASRELLLGDAVLGGHPDVGVDVPAVLEELLRGGGVEDGHRRAAEGAALAVAGQPDHRLVEHGLAGGGDDAGGVAHGVARLLGGGLVEHHLVGALGRAARTGR